MPPVQLSAADDVIQDSILQIYVTMLKKTINRKKEEVHPKSFFTNAQQHERKAVNQELH
jgi:hypothetical protein